MRVEINNAAYNAYTSSGGSASAFVEFAASVDTVNYTIKYEAVTFESDGEKWKLADED